MPLLTRRRLMWIAVPLLAVAGLGYVLCNLESEIEFNLYSGASTKFITLSGWRIHHEPVRNSIAAHADKLGLLQRDHTIVVFSIDSYYGVIRRFPYGREMSLYHTLVRDCYLLELDEEDEEFQDEVSADFLKTWDALKARRR